jgi:PhoPQ-activated pathogenicity-related protein
MKNNKLLCALIACVQIVTATVAGRADLAAYLKKPDDVFKWEKRKQETRSNGTVYDLHLVSQVWQGITWEHRVQVFLPKRIEYPGAVTLLITGGSGSEEETNLGLALANGAGVPFAILYHIPNQPLFDGKREDDLIAHTFVQYMQTGDENWPLLFPMAKSAIRAMDALGEFSKKEGMAEMNRFIVTGASKRGWTTWLTAASGDKRVKAIMPMVYDNLNIQAQMPHQIASWGKYSEQIEDYTRRGLQAQMQTPRGQKLIRMVDPYTFRNALTLPKLIINGTNDRYWAQDAMNLYWNDLRGPKWALYGPNSGHGLENSLLLVQASAVAFVRAVASEKLPPQPQWRFEKTSDGIRFTIDPRGAARSVKLWTTFSDTKDFRESRWSSRAMERAGESYSVEIPRPVSGFVAFFAEIMQEIEGRGFPSSTQIHILGGK